ncbi:hypothetical protein AL552_00865 [Vibrio diabolicus]|uniref:hypothetical protein n=1 Tax=Vibrio diabolicus TaxID=50719 RepID=UPI000CE94DFC|nr:hypothetical protein [Vibrio diabolicus]AVF92421.1 hypothetical protein AL552_00865 [Vibrio diabolicus]
MAKKACSKRWLIQLHMNESGVVLGDVIVDEMRQLWVRSKIVHLNSSTPFVVNGFGSKKIVRHKQDD